jgi:hypothetical protein
MEIERTAALAPPDSMRDPFPLDATVCPSLSLPHSDVTAVAPHNAFQTCIVPSSSLETMRKSSTRHTPTTASTLHHLSYPVPAPYHQSSSTQFATRLRHLIQAFLMA